MPRDFEPVRGEGRTTKENGFDCQLRDYFPKGNGARAPLCNKRAREGEEL